MSRPIDLDAVRQARSEEYDGARCRKCDCAWFNTQVVFDTDGSVTGYNTPPHCADCGEPLYNYGPAAPSP